MDARTNTGIMRHNRGNMSQLQRNDGVLHWNHTLYYIVAKCGCQCAVFAVASAFLRPAGIRLLSYRNLAGMHAGPRHKGNNNPYSFVYKKHFSDIFDL